jgi:hypothetical protein
MEGELFGALYRAVQAEAKNFVRAKRVQFSDAFIVLVFFWAVLHDRPIDWACNRRHWPKDSTWDSLPSGATMSRRLQSYCCVMLIAGLYHRLRALRPPTLGLCRRIDTKPLVVGGFAKDRDAKRGYATGGLARGYKLAVAWGNGLVPDAVIVAPLNVSDQSSGMSLVDHLLQDDAAATGYLLADATHDSNPLHEHGAARSFQWLTPRKQPGTGLGHCSHSAARLRSIDMLEGPSRFGRDLYRRRGDIERDLGHLCSFGGGLQSLPSWVRHPLRVVRWVLAKLILNALRESINKGLAA